MPSRSSRLIPEYTKLRISGLIWSKIIQERYKKRYFIPKVFYLIVIFSYVAISATKYILPKKNSFEAKLLHHEEKSKSSTDNLPNFTNSLVSNIEEANDTSPFKESTIQYGRQKCLVDMRKEIGSHENYKHWTLVRRRELNGKHSSISICSLNRKRDPYGTLIKHKSCLCAHVQMGITRSLLPQNNGNLPLPFFVVLTQLFTWIIFVNDCMCT